MHTPSFVQCTLKSLSFISLILTLTACGGGGSGGSGQSSTTPISSKAASSNIFAPVSSSAPTTSAVTSSLISSGTTTSGAAASNSSISNSSAISSVPVVVDSTPDNFSFNAVTNAPLGTQVISNPITIAGINTATPISITGGQYSINNSDFTSAAGTVINGQSVTIRLTTTTTTSTATVASLTIGGVSADFNALTASLDTTPDSFSFTSVGNAALNSSVTSNAITVSGLAAAAAITVDNGQYSIDGGPFTNSVGTVTNGQTITIKVITSPQPNTGILSTVTIGGVGESFTVTTIPADTTPDSFNFIHVTNAELGSEVISNSVTISGINDVAPISISGGQYSVNGGAFTSAAGTVTNGQTIRVKVIASSASNFETIALLLVGKGGTTFNVTTVPPDTTPDAFSFVSAANAAMSSWTTSDTVTITGIEAPTPISIVNGTFSIDNEARSSTTRTINKGQTVKVSVYTAGTPNTATSATLTVGGVQASFKATTLTDPIPDSFSFTPATNVKANTLVTSLPITVTGIDGPTTISITGGEYSIDGDAFTTSTNTVNKDQVVIIRLTSMAGSNKSNSATLTVGGVSGSFNVSTITDITPPTAQIVFPTSTSLTDGSTILVRGKATDNVNAIASVKVNGLLAATSDNFANWQVSVPLIRGANTLDVDVKDAASNVALKVVTATVTNELILKQPSSVAIDSKRNRALVIDTLLSAVVAIDLTSGDKTILSDDNTPSVSNPFFLPCGIAIDEPRNRALVSNPGVFPIIAVDLTTGARTPLNDNLNPTQEITLTTPCGIAVETTKNRALVIDSFEKRLVAIDLTSGARTIFSGPDTPSDANVFRYPTDIVLDVAQNRAFVIDNGAVITVDLANGARTILSDNTVSSGVAFKVPKSITLDASRNRLLVIDGKALLAVNLTNGNRTILADSSTPSGAIDFNNPLGIAFDTAHDQALVLDQNLGALISVNPTSGSRAILASSHTPTRNNFFQSPTGITIDRARNRLLISDYGLKAVVAVDITSGSRTILSSVNLPSNLNNFDIPFGIALDALNNRALVVDVGLRSVLGVDLETGARTLISSPVVPSNVNEFEDPRNIVLDTVNNRALVSDVKLRSIIAVDLMSGERTIISNATHPSSENKFVYPLNVVLDAANNRALVLDRLLPALINMNLTTGARTILSSDTIPSNTNIFSNLCGITLDAAQNRALVVSSSNLVIGVDLVSGAQTLLSSRSTKNNPNFFINPCGITLNSSGELALIIDGNAVIAMDTITGARVYFSR